MTFKDKKLTKYNIFEQLLYGIVEKQKEEENNPDKVLRGKE